MQMMRWSQMRIQNHFGIAVEANRFFASLARANAAAAGLTHMQAIHSAPTNSCGCFMDRADLTTLVGVAIMGGFWRKWAAAATQELNLFERSAPRIQCQWFEQPQLHAALRAP